MGVSIIHDTKTRPNCVNNKCFLRSQKWLVRKPFHIPKISTVLQKLEGFTSATALDLNMDYYATRLVLMHPNTAPSSYSGEIYLSSHYWWVFQVHLTSFFQAKTSVLIVALEFVTPYLDDLLCITRSSLTTC